MYVYTVAELYYQYRIDDSVRAWVDHIPGDTRAALDRAISAGHIYLYITDTIQLYINLGTAFGQRTDTQLIDTADGLYVLNEVIELWDRFGFDGLIAWTSIARQVDAVNYGEYYYDAVAYYL